MKAFGQTTVLPAKVYALNTSSSTSTVRANYAFTAVFPNMKSLEFNSQFHWPQQWLQELGTGIGRWVARQGLPTEQFLLARDPTPPSQMCPQYTTSPAATQHPTVQATVSFTQHTLPCGPHMARSRCQHILRNTRQRELHTASQISNTANFSPR